MAPLGWGWGLFVWGYALAWFLVSDRMKLLAYRVFNPSKASLLAKKPLDLTPQIARRAYELYDQRGHRDGQASRDWLDAEREIRKDLGGTGERCANVPLSPMCANRDPRSS